MSRSLVIALCALVFSAAVVSAANPLPTDCHGTQNNVPLVEFDPATATLLGTVANGTLQSVMPSGANTPLLVLNVYGDSYSMGYAYGELLKDTLIQTIPAAYSYFATKYHIDPALVNDLLDMTRNATMDFTPKWHFDLMQGISDGTGNSTTFLDIWRLAMIPEAIKATCSIVGAWGSATSTGGLLQLRALDWGTDGPFQNWPLLTNYHPNDGSFAHSSLGWAGLYGTLTGFSSSNLAVSEKVWYAYNGIDNILGYPWTFMLQDIMRYDEDIDAALARIGGAERTCAIWIGLGQGERPNPHADEPRAPATLPADFKLVASSWEQLHIYNPENFPSYPPAHPYFPDLVFVNKHVQPSTETCMGSIMNWGYGAFEATDFFQTLTALEETGDMHIAVTDFDNKQVYISNASPVSEGAAPAFTNGFVRFNMTAIWDSKAPGDLIAEW